MKKQLLLIATFLGLATGFSNKSEAQSNLALLGPRLIVNTPGSVAGNKDFTYSSDPGMTGPWGRALDSTWYMVPLVKQFDTQDTLQCAASLANAYADKWVLIFRGNCYFSDKALFAQQAGAKGVIIVNNVPGADAVGMGAGASGSQVHIPVLMVSNYDGLALDAALNAGDSVKISLTQWGFNLANDLSLVPHSMPFPHGGAIPFSQLDGTNSEYNMYTGGIVANVGSTDATNVMLNSNITWSTGGSPSVVHQDVDTLGTITNADSLGLNYSRNIFHPNETQKGVYNINYYVTSDNMDENPSDDSLSMQMYVTDSIFCKSRWDNIKGQPKSTGSVRFASASAPLTWGPLFYIKNGGYTASKFQFYLNDGDTSKHDFSSLPPVSVFMFKWVDGSNGSPLDHIMQSEELTVAGIAQRDFTTLDSNDRVLTFPIGDPTGTPGTYAKVDSNSWYWFSIDVNNTFGIGCDNNANYFGREVSANQSGIVEYGCPNFQGDNNTIVAGGQTISMIPFTNTGTTVDSIGTSVGFRTFDNLTTSTAFHFYKERGVSVKNVALTGSNFTLYPNPATDAVNVNLALSHASNVYVVISNVAGLSVMKDKRTNVQNDKLTYDISKLAPGQYYMSVVTTDGSIVKPFTVLAK